mmetsp:Transcript_20602/g.42965  ORF Transcript_20602/g.42965 Transcript_20602/m.42965 type:complete len:337 (-) Transcript_20602:727-1737(-)
MVTANKCSSSSDSQRQMKEHNTLNDSRLINNILSPELEQTIFQSLQEELQPLWSEMFHKGGAVPRLVCLQGDIIGISNDNDDGKGELTADNHHNRSMVPLYRHPADEHPPLQQWTPTVRKLRDIASNLISGQELNHALIQMYRDGDDYISEHADKTLDIERGSAIVNLSVGATRTMILRPKKGVDNVKGTPRPSTRVAMDHASLFVLGWDTNRLMTHEIKRDKREEKFKTEEERAFDGVRISITLRKIATFLRNDGSLIGQGAPKTNAVTAQSRCLTAAEEEDLLLRVFSIENRQCDYDWEELYGSGFSVINFRITNQLVAASETDAHAVTRADDE